MGKMLKRRLVQARKFKNTEISSIKILLSRARRNRYRNSRCILTVMIPALMPRAICCKKNHYKQIEMGYPMILD